MAEHPGRLALLSRAAYDPSVTPEERAVLVRHGAPGHDLEQALQVLRQAAEAHRNRNGYEASRLLNGLLEPPPEDEV